MLDNQSFTNIDSLPEEILIHIFSFLSPQDLLNAGLVRKLWQDVLKEPSLWRNLITQHFPYLVKIEKYQTEPQTLFITELKRVSNDLKHGVNYPSIKPFILIGLRGDIEKIQKLAIPKAVKLQLFILACSNGHITALNGIGMKKAFILAAQNGYLPAIQKILNHAGLPNVSESKGSALKMAAKHGHLDVVSALLAHAEEAISAADKNRALKNAIQNKHFEVAQAMSTQVDVDISAAFENLLVKSPLEDVEIIKTMLHKFGDLIPTRDKGKTLRSAATDGQLSLVEFLLMHAWQAIPPDDKAFSLRIAILNGHIEVIQAILSQADETIQAFDKGIALKDAAIRGYLIVVQSLLSHIGQAISGHDISLAFIAASEKGHLSVVQFLLNPPGETILAMDKERALNAALEYAQHDVVQAIINSKISATDKGFMLKKATRESNLKMIQVLLQNDQEIPVKDIVNALSEATSDGYLYRNTLPGFAYFNYEVAKREMEEKKLKQLKITSLLLEKYGKSLSFINLIRAIGFKRACRFNISKKLTTLVEGYSRVIHYLSSISIFNLSWFTSKVNNLPEPMDTVKQSTLPPAAFQQWTELESMPLQDNKKMRATDQKDEKNIADSSIQIVYPRPRPG